MWEVSPFIREATVFIYEAIAKTVHSRRNGWRFYLQFIQVPQTYETIAFKSILGKLYIQKLTFKK